MTTRSAFRRSLAVRTRASNEGGALRPDQVVPMGLRLEAISSSLTDDRLALHALQMGNRAAMAAWYARHWPRLVRFYIAQGCTDAEAQDIASEVLVDLLTNRTAFDPARGSAATWLWTAARRRLNTVKRTKATRARLEAAVLGVRHPGASAASNSSSTLEPTCPVTTLAAGQVFGEPAPPPMEQVERADERRAIRLALRTLPRRTDRLALARAALRDYVPSAPPLTGAERVAAHSARRRAAAHIRRHAPHLRAA
jgi:DNA-directed RNA polymerase specialized sigma24 family protein